MSVCRPYAHKLRLTSGEVPWPIDHSELQQACAKNALQTHVEHRCKHVRKTCSQEYSYRVGTEVERIISYAPMQPATKPGLVPHHSSPASKADYKLTTPTCLFRAGYTRHGANGPLKQYSSPRPRRRRDYICPKRNYVCLKGQEPSHKWRIELLDKAFATCSRLSCHDFRL